MRMSQPVICLSLKPPEGEVGGPLTTDGCICHSSRSQCAGLTLAEILISLVLLSLGLAFLLGALPVMLKDSGDATEYAQCQAIAVTWYSILKALPIDADDAAVQAAFTEIVGEVPPEIEAPALISSEPSLMYSPPDDSDAFTDWTVSRGDMQVAIKYCDAVSGTGQVAGRLYCVFVRRLGSTWKSFPFVRAWEAE